MPAKNHVKSVNRENKFVEVKMKNKVIITIVLIISVLIGAVFYKRQMEIKSIENEIEEITSKISSLRTDLYLMENGNFAEILVQQTLDDIEKHEDILNELYQKYEELTH
jgi:hypothetical protein